MDKKKEISFEDWMELYMDLPTSAKPWFNKWAVTKEEIEDESASITEYSQPLGNVNVNFTLTEETMPKSPKELAFVMYKPDAFERGLVGELMTLVDAKGLRMVFAKTLKVTQHQLEQHYNHHVGKGFWPGLVDYITSGTTMACVYQGENANVAIRQLIGNSKHPTEVPPGSIRGKYATAFPKNLIHGSDNWEAAVYEMEIFLTPDETKLMQQISKHG